MRDQYCKPVCQSFESVFCPDCGRADKARLKTVRLPGFVGVQHSTSPRIEEFWATGDPDVFTARKG